MGVAGKLTCNIMKPIQTCCDDDLLLAVKWNEFNQSCHDLNEIQIPWCHNLFLNKTLMLRVALRLI